MSRLVNLPVTVEVDDGGAPVRVDGYPVLALIDHFRAWMGVLQGEPQVDVWKVETARGVCELRYRCHPTGNEDTTPGSWALSRWED